MARGFTPRKRTDRWRIAQEGPLLSFYRSASGECVFELDPGAGLLRVAGLEGFSPDDRRAVLGYLIDKVLLGRQEPPPEVAAFARLEPDRKAMAWRNLIG